MVRSTAIGGFAPEQIPATSRLRVVGVSMSMENEYFPGPVRSVHFFYKIDNGPERSEWLLPVESEDPLLSRSEVRVESNNLILWTLACVLPMFTDILTFLYQALETLNELEAHRAYTQDDPILFYFDRDALIPRLTTDRPPPRPFTVEDFPWQLDEELFDDDREEGYQQEELKPFDDSITADEDLKVNVLYSIEGYECAICRDI